MPRLSELKRKPPRILIYGPPGTGKTAFLLTAGEQLKILDFDEGLLTGLTLEDSFTEERKSVDVEFFHEDPQTFLTGNKAPLGETAFRKGIKYLNSLSTKKELPFKILGIDSITTVIQASKRDVISRENLTPGDLSKGLRIHHWGLIYGNVERFLIQARALNCGLVVLAHESMIQMEDGGHRSVVGLPGVMLPREIPPLFDEIYFARAIPKAGGKVDYTLQTQQKGKQLCRTRAQVKDGFSMSNGIKELLNQLQYPIS
jgi:hypothetical protein